MLVVQLALVAVAGILGIVAHELTHWTAARLCGYRTAVRWTDIECVWWSRRGWSWQDYAIRLAPVFVGLGALPVLFLYPSVPVWVAWLVYTVGGVRDDVADSWRRWRAASP
jgi:membrane-associated protease RseP (regulator of RpoE activity)